MGINKKFFKYKIIGSGCCLNSLISFQSYGEDNLKILAERTNSFDDADMIIVYGCIQNEFFEFLEKNALTLDKKFVYFGNFTFVDKDIQEKILERFDYFLIGCPPSVEEISNFFEEVYYDSDFLH